MEFHYYYLIQDIIGLIVAFIGVRMVTLCFKMMLSSKMSKNIFLLILKYTLVTASGANILFNHFGLKPWIISIILMFISAIIAPKEKSKLLRI
ncbi:hypothetical protein CHL78_014445 [Romboutsia weinsteinii]|uniref:Uncharacterized protein n=1 Tax=Romboutsia weinsteinii TaxID=2020949 RepID=A0A371J0M8_9FIRM|nr:hypothetical protein [Romboutsia weinsteinii]RDY26216.1 hypothetical protein CHL78_014445 [Romboutsia weinsteinii]